MFRFRAPRIFSVRFGHNVALAPLLPYIKQKYANIHTHMQEHITLAEKEHHTEMHTITSHAHTPWMMERRGA